MHLIKKITLAVVFLFLFANSTSSQNLVIDSLETLLNGHARTDTAKVNLLNNLAYEIRVQDPLKTKAYARQAEELAGQLDYPEGEARSLWIIGVATIYNDKKGALDNFRKALKIADDTGDKIGQCNYLIAIGNTEKLQGDPTASSETYRQALRIAQEIGDKKLIIKAQINISGSFVRSGNHLEANTLLRESIELAKEINYQEMIARAYAYLGLIYNLQGNYPNALEYYLSALAINEVRSDYVGIHDCLKNIADIQSNNNDLDQALETTNKALQLSIQKQDSMRLSSSYNMLGNIYRRMNRPEALGYFQKSRAMLKFNKIPQVIDNLLSIASIYAGKGEFHKAMSSLDEALELAHKAGTKRLSGEVYARIGVTYLEQGKYGQAKDYIYKALAVAEETTAINSQQKCHKLLSEIYAATGNFRQAYTSQIQYKRLSDSLFNEKNTKQIALLESSYKFDKERKVYELEKSGRELQIKNQRQTIVSLIAISLLVFLLALVIYGSGRLRKRMLNLEIENINRELEANQKAMAVATLKLVQKSERDTYNIKVLEEIGKKVASEEQGDLCSLINSYKTQTNLSNWEEFETLFTKVNTSFWDKLNELCPSLTPNERKLCVFLKLNMNSKDIALITFQSEEALKKSRLRLRKKLDLDRSINLTAFIQNL